jgi:Uma2 family endonuclease
MGKVVEPKSRIIPPLRDGDRISRPEFIRRYEATPYVTRAELINGVVHVIAGLPVYEGKETGMIPINDDLHGMPHSDAITWLGYYAAHTPGVKSSAPTSVYSPDEHSMPEPDAQLRLLPEYGGKAKKDAKGFLHGAPELVVEVANRTANHDLGPKFERYFEDGVEEYLVVRTRLKLVDWFVRGRTTFLSLKPDADGVYRSHTFPGLWLKASALLSGNTFGLLQALQQGLASPGHAAFVGKLKRRVARKKK